MSADIAEWTGEGWRIIVDESAVQFTGPSGANNFDRRVSSRLEVRRRWLRWGLYNDGDRVLRLRGIQGERAGKLARALGGLAVADAVAWQRRVAETVESGRVEQRWIPTEAVDRLLSSRPPADLAERVRKTGVATGLTAEQRTAVAFVSADVAALVADTNETTMAAELDSRRQFFNTIESSPLTDEQARAVVCFDSRVQVLAAAGSGKTSVMVARAAYAVSRGFVAADRILLLAFNKAAATERGCRSASPPASKRPASTRAGYEPPRFTRSD